MIFFSHKTGQLGNRLFTFAHLIANAAENNIKISNLAFDEYAQYFQSTEHDLFCRYPNTKSLIKSNDIRTFLLLINRIILKLLRKLNFRLSAAHGIVVADMPEYTFEENRYFDLNDQCFQKLVARKPIIFLFGRFFRDYPNFEKHQNVIRQFFMPTDNIQTKVENFMENARKGVDLIVGVHIRRGDYGQFLGGKYFYNQEDYCRTLQLVQLNIAVKKMRFIICSNETINEELFKGVDFIVGPGHLIEDMYVLSSCDLIIGPPSTYSTWAAFYGNKPICQLTSVSQSPQSQDFKILPSSLLYNFC